MIPAERAHLHVAASTHPGMSGKNNEDRYGVSAFLNDPQKKVPVLLAVVADGIGGHRAGEVAAQIAVETITQAVAASDLRQPTQTLYEAVVRASQSILEQSEVESARKGMGSTCACALIIGDQLFTINVGDSRIYLIRGGQILKLTTDHTWVQEALDLGALTEDQARNHPNAHVIRRYLGSRQPVIPDLRLHLAQAETDEQAEANQGQRLLPNDQLVLCSDGLTDLVEDREILAAMENFKQEEALDKLVGMANQRGGHDNITIIALQVPEAVPQAAVAGLPVRIRRPRLAFTCLGVAGLVTIAALVTGGIFFFVKNRPLPGVNNPTPTTALITSTPFQALPTQTSPSALVTPTVFVTRTALPATASFTPASITPLSATLTPWPTNTTAP